MSATFTPYFDSESPSIPTNSDAYIPVRVTEAPRSDGSMLVYLPDGTAFVVNSQQLLRLDADQSGRTRSIISEPQPTVVVVRGASAERSG